MLSILIETTLHMCKEQQHVDVHNDSLSSHLVRAMLY